MNEVTVGELRAALAGFDDDVIVHLPGGLSFYRIKRLSDGEVFFEPNEALAYLSTQFVRKYPQVKCAFIKSPGLDDDELVSGPFSVTL